MPTAILRNMDQQISHGQRPAKITKSSYKQVKIKDPKVEELKAKS